MVHVTVGYNQRLPALWYNNKQTQFMLACAFPHASALLYTSNKVLFLFYKYLWF